MKSTIWGSSIYFRQHVFLLLFTFFYWPWRFFQDILPQVERYHSLSLSLTNRRLNICCHTRERPVSPLVPKQLFNKCFLLFFQLTFLFFSCSLLLNTWVEKGSLFLRVFWTYLILTEHRIPFGILLGCSWNDIVWGIMGCNSFQAVMI